MTRIVISQELEDTVSHFQFRFMLSTGSHQILPSVPSSVYSANNQMYLLVGPEPSPRVFLTHVVRTIIFHAMNAESHPIILMANDI